MEDFEHSHPGRVRAPQRGENASGMLPNRHVRAEVLGLDPGDFGPAMAVGWTPVRRDFRNRSPRSAKPLRTTAQRCQATSSTLAAAALPRSSGGCWLRAPRTNWSRCSREADLGFYQGGRARPRRATGSVHAGGHLENLISVARSVPPHALRVESLAGFPAPPAILWCAVGRRDKPARRPVRGAARVSARFRTRIAITSRKRTASRSPR